MIFAFYVSTLIIGIALGLLGSGGSILLVPLMVYMLSMSPIEAASNSLIVVGIGSLLLAFWTYKYEPRDKIFLIWFGCPSAIGIMLMRGYFLPLIPEILGSLGSFTISKNGLIMSLFALCMAIVGRTMIKQSISADHESYDERQYSFLLILLGLFVGLLSGLLGIGGGFIIVPILVTIFGYRMSQAVSLSIVLISFNAMLGFLSSMTMIQPDLTLIIFMTLCCTSGMLLGARLREKIEPNKLKVGFGYFILCVSVFILTKEVIST